MENNTVALLSKLALARTFIKSKKLKKDGTNEYSKYNYYTPEYVDSLVNEACIEANIICLFNLQCDQFGYFGEISTFDLESGENIVTIMRTAQPLITATNATQQMGGMNTYTKRYAFMSLFGIEDNTIDFDSQDNTKKTTSQPKQDAPQKEWINPNTDRWKEAVKALQSGTVTIQKIKIKYNISKPNELLLIEQSNISA